MFNLHWLDNSSVVLHGVQFIGATLWFAERANNRRYFAEIPDFSRIPDLVPWAYGQHEATRLYLQANLDADSVLVTHHLPHPASIHRSFLRSNLNRFFLGDISDILTEKQPVRAVHGHTHEPCDYQVGRTRVLCNPLGYPREGAIAFKPKLTLEV